ncbi:hypothetical protein ElyMa_003141600 [Elysia marginata]|uniref:Uncharacterized protein n=1 Tax=Elysia marginata TaxID=1093978 RepID=A0AAV4IUK8_9GAST|nr:hypothetical protein ElyMa_003141600 [Elysia marginata]
MLPERGCDRVCSHADHHLSRALVRHLQAADLPADSDTGHRLCGGHLDSRSPGLYTAAPHDGGNRDRGDHGRRKEGEQRSPRGKATGTNSSHLSTRLLTDLLLTSIHVLTVAGRSRGGVGEEDSNFRGSERE